MIARTQKTGRTTALITLVVMLLQCFPTAVFGLDLKLKENVHAFVEQRNKLLQTATARVNQSFLTTADLMTKLTKGGFSVLESRTGLNEQNRLYGVAKNHIARDIGTRIGFTKATKDFSLSAVSFGTKLLTAPAGVLDLAYKIKEKPQEYKQKAISGAQIVAGIVANPKLMLDSVYQCYKNAEDQAKKDPFKMGELQGQTVFFAGTLLLGGGTAKTVSSVNKLEKIKLNNLLQTTKNGFVAFKNDQTATFLPRFELPFTYKIGDIFEGVRITAKKDNQLILANEIRLYENTKKPRGLAYDQIELVQFSHRKGLVYDDDLDLPLNGWFLYVLDHKGKLLLTKLRNDISHSQIAQGKPVMYAGVLSIKDGLTHLITNSSGHYMPVAKDFKYVLPVLKTQLPDVSKESFKAIKRRVFKNVADL